MQFRGMELRLCVIAEHIICTHVIDTKTHTAIPIAVLYYAAHKRQPIAVPQQHSHFFTV